MKSLENISKEQKIIYQTLDRFASNYQIAFTSDQRIKTDYEANHFINSTVETKGMVKIDRDFYQMMKGDKNGQ